MTALLNAFLAIGGLCIAIFAVFAIIAIGLHLYLSLESFVASKFAEDAGADWTDPDGGISAVKDVFHFGTSTTRRRNDHAGR